MEMPQRLCGAYSSILLSWFYEFWILKFFSVSASSLILFPVSFASSLGWMIMDYLVLTL